MRKKIAIHLILILLVFTNVQAKNPVLFSINGMEVTKDEFLYIYNKNNPNVENPYQEEKVREYLDLYINFKLKVKDAIEKGIDTTEQYLKDFENYREQLTKPYLTDVNVTDQLIREAYNRMQTEVRASHILIKLDKTALPKDTLKAYNKLLEARKQLIEGADFGEIAKKYSEDPSVRHNSGDLGYFSAFSMVYPFESAVYEIEVGEISMPFRTSFGYHIAKKTGKRAAKGEINASHLMIAFKSEDSEHREFVKKKADSLYQKLLKGANFEELTIEYSDDVRSSRNGGVLPPMQSVSPAIPESFLNAAFALENDGDFSKPVKTDFGWHIIKRNSLKPVPTFDEAKHDIKTRISRDERADIGEQAVINRIKSESKFREHRKPFRKFDQYIDSTLLQAKWSVDKDVNLKRLMFRIGKEKYSQRDFAQYLENNQKPAEHNNLEHQLNQYYKAFVNETVLDHEKKHLKDKYPDYRNLVREYREGILLFEITNEKVWRKAASDTIGLNEFFNNNIENYQWEKRAKVVIFEYKNEDKTEILNAKIKNSDMSAVEIGMLLNKDNPLALKVEEGTFEKDKHPVLDKIKWEKGIHTYKDVNGNHFLVKIEEIIPPQTKKLSETKGKVISDYQNYLEKEWLKELRSAWKVNLNEEVLKSIIQ